MLMCARSRADIRGCMHRGTCQAGTMHSIASRVKFTKFSSAWLPNWDHNPGANRDERLGVGILVIEQLLSQLHVLNALITPCSKWGHSPLQLAHTPCSPHLSFLALFANVLAQVLEKGKDQRGNFRIVVETV